LESAAARVTDLEVSVETLDDVIEECTQYTDSLQIAPADRDTLRLLIFASGSTGSPKGAMYTDHLLTKAGADGWSPTGTPIA
jgi:fatty acid CoA ligase FadD9